MADRNPYLPAPVAGELTSSACNRGAQPVPPNEHLERAFQEIHLLTQATGRKHAEEKARQAARELERRERRSDAWSRPMLWGLSCGPSRVRSSGRTTKHFSAWCSTAVKISPPGRVRWKDLTPIEWRDQDELAVAELEATGIFQPFEKEYSRKDGSRVPVLLGGTLFEGNEGVAFISI